MWSEFKISTERSSAGCKGASPSVIMWKVVLNLTHSEFQERTLLLSPLHTLHFPDALFMRTSTFTFVFQNNQKYLGHQVRRRSFSRETSLLKKAKSHKPAQSCLYTEVVSINLKRIFHSDSTILLSQCTAKQAKGGAKDLGKKFLSPTF